jgi:hypothetical protein
MRLPLSVILLCAACSSTPALTLTATPNPLPGDGVTPGTVVANVTSGGSPADAMVHFTTTVGTFKESLAGTPLVADIAASGGIATANLVPPRQGWGQVAITAAASLDGKQVSASATLPLIPAGGAANTLSFRCLHQNIGGMVHGRQDTLHMLCVATAFLNNKPIANASVQTLTEAGALDWAHDDNGVQQFVYSVRPDDPSPKDVGPFDSNGHEQAVCPAGCVAAPFDGNQCPGEPCWTDPTGITHNPRDGIVTLVAAVPGVKSFDDQGEPFVDANDNGVWDPGEAFIDYNGNGKWDAPDGKVKDRLIWKAYRVIWSGEAAITPSGATRNSHDAFLTKSGADLSFTVFDRNFNAVAADGPSAQVDQIEWAADCSPNDGQVTLALTNQALNQLDPGVLFEADTGKISAPQLHTTWLRGTTYTNHSSFTGTAGQGCSVTAQTKRQYDPGAPDISPGGTATDPDIVLVAGFPFP